MKRIIKIVSLLTLSFVFIFSSSLLAQESGYDPMVTYDPETPETWWEDPKLASEYNITEFNEAPMLKERVEKGEIPSVEERLPTDPPVIEPFKEIGEYGGRFETFGTQKVFYRGDAMMPFQRDFEAQATPDGTGLNAWLIKDWEYSNEGKTLTLYLREGIKWSDGHPFTVEDYVYWYDHVATNENLEAIPPSEQLPVGLSEVEKLDDYTISFHYEKPYLVKENELHYHFWQGTQDPKHYMKQFHIDFRDKEELQKEVEEAGFDHWYQYYDYKNDRWQIKEDEVQPSMNPYVIKEQGADYIIAERNPYFPFVDPEGNQLPYIDEIRQQGVSDEEMITTNTVAGEATLSAYYLSPQDLPVYHKYKEERGYRVLLYNSALSSQLALIPNYNHEDQEMREIFQDIRFRKALSLAIDREEINDRVFLGMAEPAQATILPNSRYYESEWKNAFAEYNPERAQELLDEMGMVDQNGDDYRDTPNGEAFNPDLMYIEHEGPRTAILELVQSYLGDVGINLDLSLITRELYQTRQEGGNWDLTEWHIDRTPDLMFDAYRGMTFTPFGNSAPEWETWVRTEGDSGVEPPEEVKKIHTWQQKMVESPVKERIEYGKNILRSQAENLWKIGTVAYPPRVVVVDENLKNIPETGLLTDDLQWMGPYYPSQFYLKE